VTADDRYGAGKGEGRTNLCHACPFGCAWCS
jgi:hypothetical protein